MKIPLEDRKHYPHLFKRLSKKSNTAKKLVVKILTHEHETISRQCDETGIQDSCQVRNVLKARELACALIDDDGKVDDVALNNALEVMEANRYSLGPGRYVDNDRDAHIIDVLRQVKDEKDKRIALQQIGKPYSNPMADEIIRSTLLLEPNTQVTDAHTRQATLSAWLCFLRQNVGSCFATAPAIIIHGEQSDRFLQDINDLLSKGYLIRTFGGVEHSVPLAASWGIGDLKKPFTLAKKGKEFSPPPWKSPGIIAALNAAEVPPKKRKSIIIQTLCSRSSGDGSIVVTAEELIRKILMDDMQLTDEMLKEFSCLAMRASHIDMMVASVKRLGNGKGERFERRFAEAKAAFISLTENPLLKAWEFSLASFCDTKTDFSRWNLYSSLGMEEDQAHGIGQIIYGTVQAVLDTVNAEAKEYHEEYDRLFPHVRSLEMRIKRASSEQEAKWIRAEYQRSVGELNTYIQKRDRARQRGKVLAELPRYMVGWYITKFPEYFQEVYDADMHDVKTGPYDDSPAGFRLLYKHGRSNVSLWSLIRNEMEYVDTLASFFTITENELINTEGLGLVEREVSDIVTKIVSTIKTREFLEYSFHRMAIAHNMHPVKDPLDNIDKIEKKPWVYTSGGTMNTLINCYYQLDQNPMESSKWVEEDTELLVYLLDCMREMPHNLSQLFEHDSNRSMLMHSPTHAFVLKPGLSPFKDGWVQTDTYTYTWVRDELVIPRQQQITGMNLSREEGDRLIEHLAKKVSADRREELVDAIGYSYSSATVPQWRNCVIDALNYDTRIQHLLSSADVDSMLFSALPVFPYRLLRERIEQLFAGVAHISVDDILKIFDEADHDYSSRAVLLAKEFHAICMSLLILLINTTRSPIDFHSAVLAVARKEGFVLQEPILFADTNWIQERFAFVVNPGTAALELWRVDPLCLRGAPMSHWRHWLNGSRQNPQWGIYTIPYQYGSA